MSGLYFIHFILSKLHCTNKLNYLQFFYLFIYYTFIHKTLQSGRLEGYYNYWHMAYIQYNNISRKITCKTWDLDLDLAAVVTHACLSTLY